MNTKKLLAGAALVTLSAGLAAPVQAASDTGQISAVVVQPITVSAVNTLAFGSFSVNGTGAFDVSPAGVARGVTDVNNTPIGGTIQAGSFTITADTRVMTVSVDTAAIIKNTATTAKTMNVTGINFNCTTAKWQVTTAAGATNAACNLATSPGTVTVGGTLNFVATQTPGIYTGSYTLTASY